MTLNLKLVGGLFAIFALFFMAGINQAVAQPNLIAQHGNWAAYHHTERSGKVCFMASKPISAKGNYTRRGDIFALVTHRPADRTRDVVSFVAGYTFKPDSNVTVNIDGKKFELFTRGDTAWAVDSKTDKALANAMRNGNRMIVKGRSSRGTLTTDTYSLKGSTAAHNAINKACY